MTSFVATALLFAWLLRGSLPSLQTGDSAELAAASATLGVSHPPGYPLHTLVGKAVATLMPWGHLAYRLNLASALTLAAGCGVAAAAFMRMGAGALAAGGAAVALGATAAAGVSGSATEVFGLNLLMAALITWMLAGNGGRGQAPPVRATGRGLCVAALLFGVGMGNHHTLLLGLPGWAWMGWRQVKAGRPEGRPLRPTRPGSAPERTYGVRTARMALLCLLLGLMVYAVLPVRAMRPAGVNWDDPSNPARFTRVVTRGGYGGMLGYTQARTLGDVTSRMGEGTATGIKFLAREWSWIGLAAGVAGLIAARAWPLALLWLGIGPGFFAIAGQPATPQSWEILQRFTLLGGLPIAAGVAMLPRAWQMAGRPEGRPLRTNIIGVAVPLMLAGYLVSSSYADLGLRREDFVLHDEVMNHLRGVPKNARLFVDRADEVLFGLGYAAATRMVRTDVEIRDCHASLLANPYGDAFRSMQLDARYATRGPVEIGLIHAAASTGRTSLYATLSPTKLWDLPLRRFGLLYSVGETLRENPIPGLVMRGWGSEPRGRRIAQIHRAMIP